MRRIEVALGERSYPVWLGNGLVAQTGELLRPFARDGRLVTVTDSTVWEATGERLREGLRTAGIEPEPVIVPSGEPAKSWPSLIALVDRLLELGLERSDHILAFGGGAVGDLAGFAAAILKRGCGFVQIPTTLLAQVDSSVGGKTAINSAAGKNLVGAFHQPAAVLIDPTLLDTLDPRQVRAGYAEIVKCGLIGDADFFAWCEANGGAVIGGNREVRLQAVEASLRFKAGIVAEDERERSGRRALLNLGHTFGHAIEAEAGLHGAILHGEAVAVGMILGFRFSAERGLCSPEEAARVQRHLTEVGLPASLAEIGLGDGAALLPHMLQDKKNEAGRLRLILVRGIGQAFVDGSVDHSEVRGFLGRQG